jgi:hypothetical protein
MVIPGATVNPGAMFIPESRVSIIDLNPKSSSTLLPKALIHVISSIYSSKRQLPIQLGWLEFHFFSISLKF